MKTQAAVAGLLSLAGLASTTSAEPSWHNLAITAPRYGRYLTRTVSEEPFFWQADTAWELVHRLNKTSIEFYLKTRAEQGYNIVQTVVVSELSGTTRSNFYGDLPFNNSDPTQPNDAYFELVDWTVDLAASYGILIALVPTWGMYVNGGWHSTTPIFNESNAYEWGKYIGERYPGLPKILGGDSNAMWSWNMSEVQAAYAEDPDQDLPSLLAPIEDTSSVWASMRYGLKEAESSQGYESVVIYHPTAGWIVKPEVTPEAYGHNMLPDEEDRMSIDAVQSGHATPDPTSKFTPTVGWDSTKNYELIANMRDRFTGPVLDLENHYEGAHDSFNLERQIWNSSQIRTGLYHGVYGGATGFTYGANSVWQMYEPRSALLRDSDYYAPQINQNASGSWREDIFFEGATQTQYVTKPLQNLTTAVLETLEPARELLGSVSNHTGRSVNTYEGTRYISVLASQSRDHYYVYTGHGDSFALQLDNGSGARSGSARWFSPRDGQYYADATVSVPESGNATRINFTPPSGGSIDDDWLLVLEF
ncbi:hypothetical protein JG687_00014445 [Phytophthora cactorum]|uniref:DUF4038 domain-containing protein n=1 Tax=Phytophthora cactorum TaxID=29920 RepID=A0A8T1TZS8_9STRA|nr:hypothetical protein PC120_g5197 [Phytophthora cactorum]KAG3071297.1 hypothetical protein PC121_g9303 [Phytophthora cactorum]KAG3190450.1 hypothetical protein PC128_g11296 [Phytophthora cactorum]KAG4057410.1 hypothetical protein PC123_g7579 [Phytophthora cactorum]KAG6950120.1 hypothetical protein JG687_00014445 [Phytophthora cactorum]